MNTPLTTIATELRLRELLAQRILILDGAMGTMIQRYGLGEADFRGERLADHAVDVRGNNELLCLTRPDIVREIHQAYLAAGADLDRDQHLRCDLDCPGRLPLGASRLRDERRSGAIARAGLRRVLDRRAAALCGRRTRTDTEDGLDLARRQRPGCPQRHLRPAGAAYGEQVRGLLDGGADLLLVETIFDTLNAKAALFAIDAEFERRGERDPADDPAP
jgi:5-methyltetrahydrofolate--homocysteine methyltransferase